VVRKSRIKAGRNKQRAVPACKMRPRDSFTSGCDMWLTTKLGELALATDVADCAARPEDSSEEPR